MILNRQLSPPSLHKDRLLYLENGGENLPEQYRLRENLEVLPTPRIFPFQT